MTSDLKPIIPPPSPTTASMPKMGNAKDGCRVECEAHGGVCPNWKRDLLGCALRYCVAQTDFSSSFFHPFFEFF